jgi:hypothetical protein
MEIGLIIILVIFILIVLFLIYFGIRKCRNRNIQNKSNHDEISFPKINYDYIYFEPQIQVWNTNGRYPEL